MRWIALMMVVLLTVLAGCGSSGGNHGFVPKSAAALVGEGDTSLAADDPTAAFSSFEKAVAKSPGNQEAQFGLGVSRILAAFEDPTFDYQENSGSIDTAQDVMDELGLPQEGRSVYNFTARIQDDLSKSGSPSKPVIPDTGSTGEDVQLFIENSLLPILEASIDNLDNVTDQEFQKLYTISTLLVQDMEIDQGDVLFLRCGLHAFAAICELSIAWQADLDIKSTFDNLNNGDFGVQQYLDADLQFLRSRSATAILNARQHLQDAIDLYQAASTFIRNEIDDQSDDLIAFLNADDVWIKNEGSGDPLDSNNNELELLQLMQELEDSLDGQDTTISVFLGDKTFVANFGRMTNILHVRDFLPGFAEFLKTQSNETIAYPLANTLPDPTVQNIFPNFTQNDVTERLHLVGKYDVPVATIVINDGSLADWNGIQPQFTSTNDPAIGPEAIAAYVAVDANFIYMRIDYDSLVGPGFFAGPFFRVSPATGTNATELIKTWFDNSFTEFIIFGLNFQIDNDPTEGSIVGNSFEFRVPLTTFNGGDVVGNTLLFRFTERFEAAFLVFPE